MGNGRQWSLWPFGEKNSFHRSDDPQAPPVVKSGDYSADSDFGVETMDHLMVADIRFGSSLLPYPSYRALLKSEVRAKCSFLEEIFFYNNSPTYFKTPITSKKLVTCHPLGRHAPIPYSA